MKALTEILGKVIPPELPFALIDIGSSGGLQPEWKFLSSALPFVAVGFEPSTTEFAELVATSEQSVRFLPAAISDSAGTETLNITVSSGNSSLFAPDQAFVSRYVPARQYRVKDRIEVETLTLDGALLELGVDDPDFVKIDTEGAELKVLSGGEKTLESVFAVESEIWFTRVYQGQPLFADVDATLRARGFELLDLARSNYFKTKGSERTGRARGRLVAGDALYFKDLASGGPYPPFDNMVKISKAIAVLVRYGIFDHAVELSTWAKLHGIFDENLADEITDAIRRAGKSMIPLFKGRFRLSHLLATMSARIAFGSTDKLGN